LDHSWKVKKMKRPLRNTLILIVLLAGLLIAGERICQAVVGSNATIVNFSDIDPNEPELELEPEVI
jgi:hypothetical protein